MKRAGAPNATMIKVFTGQHIDLGVIEKSLKVYKQYFGEADLGPAEEYYNLHLHNPYVYYYAVDTASNEVVGNLEIIPFEDDYLAEFEKGMHDKEFENGSYPLNKIRQYNLPGFYSIIVELIAIAPHYQGNPNVLRALLTEFIKRLLQFSKDDIFIRDIYTDVYTNEGEKLAKYFGFRAIRSSIDGTIYKTSLFPPHFVSEFPKNIKALRERYDEKFAKYDKLLQSRELNTKLQMSPLFGQEDEKWKYAVALSFAGEQRQYVESVAMELRNLGLTVFYDFFEQAELWGKDLYQHLNDVYKNKSRYCMIFVSRAYVKRLWTKHEIKSAQARAFSSDEEYILPVMMEDEVDLPGFNMTMGYADGRRLTPRQLAELAFEKFKKKT